MFFFCILFFFLDLGVVWEVIFVKVTPQMQQGTIAGTLSGHYKRDHLFSPPKKHKKGIKSFKHARQSSAILNTPPKINMEPGNDGFQIGISFSKDPFSGSMFVLGSVIILVVRYYAKYSSSFTSSFSTPPKNSQLPPQKILLNFCEIPTHP